MGAAGMETFSPTAPDSSPDDSERARTANAVDADLVIALRCAHHPTSTARGVASFYFGNNHGSYSTIGRNLASFIQREIVARTGLSTVGRILGPGRSCAKPDAHRPDRRRLRHQS